MLSVLLYNSEVWAIGKRKMKDLEGKVVYFMRKVVGEKGRKEEEEERLSNQQSREMLGMELVKGCYEREDCSGSLTVREEGRATLRGRA